MTLALAPRLDPTLADCPVDPAAMRSWFRVPEAIRAALVGLSITVNDIRPGSSRNRKKALASAVLLLASTGIVTEQALDALAGALDLKPRDLGKRGPEVKVTWISTPEVFIDEDRPTGEPGIIRGQPAPGNTVRSRLDDEETLALRIIEHVCLHGPRLGNQLAVLDLFRWHTQQGRPLSELAVNALAVVAELVDPMTGSVKGLPGHDPNLLLAEAEYSAEVLFDQIDEETAVVAEGIGHKTLERLAKASEPFQAAVANGADPDKLLAEPTRSGDWARLAGLTGLTRAELLAQAGARASVPRRAGLKASGLPKQTAWDVRSDPRFEALENDELKRLGKAERTQEQLRAMRSDAFAAAGGDPAAKARLRTKAAIGLK